AANKTLRRELRGRLMAEQAEKASVVSEYTQRQYRLMLERLDDFQRKKLKIDTLINDLEGLVNALEDLDPKWRQAFLHHWGKLEEARATALDRNARTLNAEESRIVEEALPRLRLHVLEMIDTEDHPRSID